MKFSFKKGAGGEKQAKPKGKRKSRSNGDGMASAKAMFANHGEKLLLGAVAIASIYVIYSGFKKDGLDSSPDDVRSAVSSARNKMDAPTWTEVKRVRYPEPDRFDRLASNDTERIKAEDFQTPMPFHPVLQERRQRRSDPDLLAPLELEVRPGYGAIAVREPENSSRSEISKFMSGQEDTRPLPDKVRERHRGQSLGGGETESRYFIAITGLVPVKAQQGLYREAFAKATEYSLDRDSPKYIALDIERRELDAAGKPGEWLSLDAPRMLQFEPKKWGSKLEELALKDHVMARLMMPLPPIIFRDIRDWAVHSKIPQVEVDDRGMVREREERDEKSVDEEQFNIFGGDSISAERSRGEVATEEAEYRDEGALTDEVRDQLKVEFGMLRFFDFNVMPGTVYEYRARVLLEDPNNPYSFQAPTANACENDVIIRRQADPDKHLLESPWSEASVPVRVSSGRQVFAGKVVAPNARPVAAANGLISLPSKSTDEPVATIMGVAWDPIQKLDVPATLNVKRGAVINQAGAELEVIDPAIAKVRKLKNYDFATNVIVLDIAGGQLVDRRSDIRAPGMVLLMDENNNLSFRSELGDLDRYDFFDIPPDEELLRQDLRSEDEDKNNDDRRGRGRRAGSRGGREEAESGFEEGVEETRGRRRR